MDEDARMEEPGQVTPSRQTFGPGALNDTIQDDAHSTPQQPQPRNNHRRSYSSVAAFSAFTMSHLDSPTSDRGGGAFASSSHQLSPSPAGPSGRHLSMKSSLPDMHASYARQRHHHAPPQTVSYSFADTFTSRSHPPVRQDVFAVPSSSNRLGQRPTLSHVASAPSLSSVVSTSHEDMLHQAEHATLEGLSLSSTASSSSPQSQQTFSSCEPSPSGAREHFLSVPTMRPLGGYEYGQGMTSPSRPVSASFAHQNFDFVRGRPAVNRRATVSGGSWSSGPSVSVPVVPSQSSEPPSPGGSSNADLSSPVSTVQASSAAGALMRYLQEQRSLGVFTPNDYAAVSDLWRRLVSSEAHAEDLHLPEST
jgi:hypothetical protein